MRHVNLLTGRPLRYRHCRHCKGLLPRDISNGRFMDYCLFCNAPIQLDTN